MDNYDLVEKTMTMYEQLYEKEPTKALLNMIDLLPMASKSFNHDVFHAIIIWIQENINDDVVDYLKMKLQSDNDYKNIYIMLLDLYLKKQ